MKERETSVFSKAIDKLKWAFYDLRIKIFGGYKEPTEKQLAKSMSSRTIKKNIFLFLFLLIPTVQFLIFYVGVNFNSILMAFQEYKIIDGRGAFVLTGFSNFKDVVFDLFVNGRLATALKNSGIQFVFSLVLGIPVHVMVAYVVFKEVPFGGFLKIMLFMPNMISSLLFVVAFRYFIESGVPILFNDPTLQLLQENNASSFWVVLLFGQWMTFASGLIIYLSAMCSISTDIIEYGQLEPMSSIQELWYVIVPSIFPTITTYLVVAVAGFFTNYGYFVSFFNTQSGIMSAGKPYDTLGFYFFVVLLGNGALADYPYASAAGILFTAVAAPLTLLVKNLLEKYGPSED